MEAKLNILASGVQRTPCLLSMNVFKVAAVSRERHLAYKWQRVWYYASCFLSREKTWWAQNSNYYMALHRRPHPALVGMHTFRLAYSGNMIAP